MTLFERRQRVQTRMRRDAAVNHGADHLQIRLEPAGTHVVRVADRAADDRLLPADFTDLGHYFLPKEPKIIPQGMIKDEAGAAGASGSCCAPGGGASTRVSSC